MPYIEDHKFRSLYDGFLESIIHVLDRVPKYKKHGHINYIITKLILDTKPDCYKDFNAILGVLESVKLEMYRRIISAYEDKKIEENGDVYC